MNPRPAPLLPCEHQQIRERIDAIVKENEALQVVIAAQFWRLTNTHAELLHESSISRAALSHAVRRRHRPAHRP